MTMEADSLHTLNFRYPLNMDTLLIKLNCFRLNTLEVEGLMSNLVKGFFFLQVLAMITPLNEQLKLIL